MRLTFLVPPCFDNKQAPERSAGCTRIVYPMINIYELTLAAYLRQKLSCEVKLNDFVYEKSDKKISNLFYLRIIRIFILSGLSIFP